MAKELYRVNVNCQYTSTGARGLSSSDNRQGIAVTLAENTDVDNATPTVQKGNSGSTVDGDIYGVLLYIDEGTERAAVCTNGIVRMKMDATKGATRTIADCRHGVQMTTTADSNGLVQVAADEKGNGQIVGVFVNPGPNLPIRYDLLVDLAKKPAQVTP